MAICNKNVDTGALRGQGFSALSIARGNMVLWAATHNWQEAESDQAWRSEFESLWSWDGFCHWTLVHILANCVGLYCCIFIITRYIQILLVLLYSLQGVKENGIVSVTSAAQRKIKFKKGYWVNWHWGPEIVIYLDSRGYWVVFRDHWVLSLSFSLSQSCSFRLF